MDRDQLMADYDAAVTAEREAWLKVRGKHLGTKFHDPVLWREWAVAAERMQQLSTLLKALHANGGDGYRV